MPFWFLTPTKELCVGKHKSVRAKQRDSAQRGRAIVPLISSQRVFQMFLDRDCSMQKRSN